jgi:hypothetical protein
LESLKWLRLKSAVLDGELVALDENGRPSFNEIQNWKSTKRPIVYYVFDVLHLHGKDLLNQPLTNVKNGFRISLRRSPHPLFRISTSPCSSFWGLVTPWLAWSGSRSHSRKLYMRGLSDSVWAIPIGGRRFGS